MTFIHLFFTACLIIFNSSVVAHGIIHQQITDLTVQISQQPGNAQLILKRGQLYVDDLSWLKAQQDFNTVRQLDPGIEVVDLLEAKMWSAANQSEHCYSLVNRYLQRNPDSPVALALRAKSSLALGNPSAAALDYSRVVALSNRVLPDMYLQWARAQAQITPLNQKKVHHVIQSGLDKLGSLVVLLQYAIDFDRQHQDYQSALIGIDKLPKQLRQQPFWLVEKAKLLVLMGEHLAAKTQLQLAQDGLQEKRQSGRFNKADQTLVETIKLF
jgi:tetratricopeptide (TPR) repeat protein